MRPQPVAQIGVRDPTDETSAIATMRFDPLGSDQTSTSNSPPTPAKNAKSPLRDRSIRPTAPSSPIRALPHTAHT
jgi:hypothetical protein